MDSELYLVGLMSELFGGNSMSINGYFGVRSIEAVVEGLKNMDYRAEIALFIGVGLAAYGYFKYGKGGKVNGNDNRRKESN